jgi:co-chaperonin GroES (HSP10)
MSDILIGVDPLNPNIAFKQDDSSETRAAQLPKPTGYTILCALPAAEEAYESGLVKADSTKYAEEVTTMVLFVVAMGDQAYADPVRFPTGPWCKAGDFILTRPYAGTRVKIHGREFRLISDDNVMATVDDPRGYTRAG